MRLIDADELRKHAFKMYQSNGVTFEPLLVVPLGCIDNAPTVELDGYVLYGTGLEVVSTDWLDEQLGKDRRRGEWIDHSDEGYVECPFCGSATNCEDNKDELHYCWNCGAKMRGDKND